MLELKRWPDICRFLEKHGWYPVRITGSHFIVSKDNFGSFPVVVKHDFVRADVWRCILKYVRRYQTQGDKTVTQHANQPESSKVSSERLKVSAAASQTDSVETGTRKVKSLKNQYVDDEILATDETEAYLAAREAAARELTEERECQSKKLLDVLD